MLIYQRLREATDAKLLMIPAGQVFYELALAIENDEVAGYDSAYDLYRDDLHASYGLGRYAAAATTYASIYGNLDGITSASLNAQTSAFVNQTILDVIDDGWLTGVPEPSTALLLALVAVATHPRRRHRREPA